RYEGKTAVITGGTTGIGFATAKLLVSEGARVVVTGRTTATVAGAERELGAGARGIAADTSVLADLDRVVELASSHLGDVDLVFVNAGIARFAPFDAVDERLWDEQHDINVRGAFFAVQKLVPLVPRGGAIVLNASIVATKGFEATTAYSASKAALRSLGRTLAAELLPRGIRVNVVSPGPITTPIFEKSNVPPEARAAMAEQFREAVPMKRFGLPEEVGRAALFLAFDATFTTGADLPVDGGIGQV
ncbi:MAG: SDR family oxidoreductase, partial [Myxococcales bacterium]|nr:SDR family oxidoreductase [Myxococcales bacterium]